MEDLLGPRNASAHIVCLQELMEELTSNAYYAEGTQQKYAFIY